jgi:hypothetical protein
MGMNIYIAGYFQARINTTIYGLPGFLIRPSWILESYHYANIRLEKAMREGKYTMFLDSGAFSAFTQGASIDLNRYAAYIKKNQDIIHQAASLDIIGSGSEQGTYNNQKKLESLGCQVLPTHHARDHDDWLKRYLGEGYTHLCLGGMVPENSQYLQIWLDHVFSNYLTNPDGTAKVKVHGFGLTSVPLMTRYPFHSVDSTAWVMTSRFGQVFVDLPSGIRKIDFSLRSQKRRDIDSWHFQSLDRKHQDQIVARLEELEKTRIRYPQQEEQLKKATGWQQGWTPQCFANQYGWRDNFNIAFFERISKVAPDRFTKQQETLF